VLVSLGVPIKGVPSGVVPMEGVTDGEASCRKVEGGAKVDDII